MNLSVADFSSFHQAVHGSAPFEWQTRLLREVVGNRGWPRTLELPTGTGKTTSIDVALFALALDAAKPPDERWCPRRIAMVVDRRVIVDQAAERGRKIRAALWRSAGEVVQEVAGRLASLGGDTGSPLGVFTLRGGIPRDDTWARTPDQPLVLASTVDQLGSRLLIQGYGVSDSMRPIHAGLLANDTLVLLDEVHLSRPFAQTLDALSGLRGSTAPRRVQLPTRFHHVFLSATPGPHVANRFALTEEEKAKDSPLGQRLHASKPTRLVKVRDRRSLEQACVEAARELVGRHAVVAVILNRVASACTVAGVLQRELGSSSTVVVLTGRMRPLDRDDIVEAIRPQVAAGRDRTPAGSVLVVVGTQCIEAGADFDFDALVTESASLDALKQRFGRLDRLGHYGSSEGVIVHVVHDEREDPIYGDAAAKTFEWLESHSMGARKRIVNLGTMALPQITKDEEDTLLSPRCSAPMLLPAYLDLWIQTSPRPAALPDVALWLHGPRAGPADVQVVWRCDLQESDLESGHEERAISIVASVRPTGLEAVSVPFSTARSWLVGADPSLEEVADVEIGTLSGELPPPSEGARAVRWRGARSEVIGATELRPGDTLVVPSTRGGLRSGSFDPSMREPVADLAERATLLARGRPLLRLHPAVLNSLRITIPTGSPAEARATLMELAMEAEPNWRKVWMRNLAAPGLTTTVDADPPWEVLSGRRIPLKKLVDAMRSTMGREAGAAVEGGIDIVADEGDDASFAGAVCTLAVHSKDVERFARGYGSRLGFPAKVAEDVALAGCLHDIGKADRRFQLWLRGGSEIDLIAEETPWAKSPIASESRDARRAARLRSGYPEGARHEVQSLAMAEASRGALAPIANDLDLVFHLVASSHGFCRPFAPTYADPHRVDVTLRGHQGARAGVVDFGPVTSDHGLYRLDSPLAERFWQLVERYGWYELCWLEAVLRLADHRASEEEENGEIRRGVE